MQGRKLSFPWLLLETGSAARERGGWFEKRALSSFPLWLIVHVLSDLASKKQRETKSRCSAVHLAGLWSVQLWSAAALKPGVRRSPVCTQQTVSPFRLTFAQMRTVTGYMLPTFVSFIYPLIYYKFPSHTFREH